MSEINANKLSEDENKILRKAQEQDLTKDNNIKIDISNSVMVDKNDDIMKLKNVNGEITIYGDNNLEHNEIEFENEQKNKTFQKTLTPNPNSIYSANNN